MRPNQTQSKRLLPCLLTLPARNSVSLHSVSSRVQPVPEEERIPLGGLVFRWSSLRGRMPAFMYLDSKFSLPVLERRVVRAIFRSADSQRQAHHLRPLMTLLRRRIDSGSGGGRGRDRLRGEGLFRIPFW
jgi:hypothetical protein